MSLRNSKERFALFPKLRDAGVTSTDNFLGIAGHINAERRQRQEERERREREEAKERGQQKVQDIIEKLRKGREGKYNIFDDIRRFLDDHQ